MTLKIGSFEISTQALYDALKACSVTNDADLKKIDKNGDNKISEDELVEFDESAEDSTTTSEAEAEKEGDEKSSSSSDLDDSQKSAIDSLMELNMSLMEQLLQAQARFATSNDAEQVTSIIDTIQSLQDQIKNNETQILNLMIQAETPTITTSGTSSVSGVSKNKVTAVGNFDTSSAAAFAMSLVDNGNKSVDTATMKELMTSSGNLFHDGAWCGDFCAYVLEQTYGRNGTPGDYLNTCSNYSYLPTIVGWAQENGVYSSDVSQVQPGDLICYGQQHVGMVVGVNSDGTVNTVEGNTSGNNGDYYSPTGEGWASYHANVSGNIQFVLLHKLK